MGLVSCGLVIALGRGCANDFDGLFRSDGGAAPGDDASEPGDGAPTAVVDSGFFKCPGGTTACSRDCLRGEACRVECDALETCTLGCTGCSAVFTCKEKPKHCDVNCSSKASCDTSCDSDECAMKCSPDSQCSLTCKANAGPCDLDCQGGEKRTCPNRVFTCNRPCP